MLCVVFLQRNFVNIIIAHLYTQIFITRERERDVNFGWGGGGRWFSLVQYFDLRISSEMPQPLVSSGKLA